MPGRVVIGASREYLEKTKPEAVRYTAYERKAMRFARTAFWLVLFGGGLNAGTLGLLVWKFFLSGG